MDPRQRTAKKGDDVYDMTKKMFLKQLLFPTSRRKNLKLQGKNMKVMVQKAS